MRTATLSIALLLSLPLVASAQTRIDVPQGFGSLNTAIENAADPGNSVFVLARGGTYLLNGPIQNDFPLRIEAAAGDGARPLIQPGVRSSGSSADVDFRAQADLTITGVSVTGLDDTGNLTPRFVDIVTNSGSRVVLDDVEFDYIRYAMIEAKAADATIVIRNSTARNLFQVGNSGNGRMVNVRGVEIDSVIVENNSFYNFNAGVTTSGGGFVEQLVFNHNTIYNAGNGMTYDNLSGFIPNQTVVNNIFVNARLRGTTDAGLGATSVNGVFTAPDLAPNGYPVAERAMVFRNNNFFYTAEADAYFAQNANLTPVSPSQFYSEFNTQAVWDSLASDASPMSTIEPVLVEVLAFLNPPLNPDFLTYHKEFFNDGQAENLTDPYIDGPFDVDFSYASSTNSYTAAGGNCPLGDLRWFEDDSNVNVAQCLANSFATPAEVGPNGGAFAVRTFGNPVRSRLALEVTLDGPAETSIALFDVLGRQVAHLGGAVEAVGTRRAELDVSGLAPGVYVYRVTARSAVGVSALSGQVTVVR